jgi:hypothetical protein
MKTTTIKNALAKLTEGIALLTIATLSAITLTTFLKTNAQTPPLQLS